MKRYAFYFVVSLSAFGIGIFACVVFVLWKVDKTETADFERIKNIKFLNSESDETNTGKVELPQNSINKNIDCEDEATKTVWKKLEKDKNLIKWAFSIIESNHINNCQEFFDSQTLDLNNDKFDEILLKGKPPLFCGSGGDCQTWIVSKINNEYRIILEIYAGEDSDGLRFLPEKTNKFKNLKVKKYNHWEADSFGYFKFDGKKYQIKKCFKDINSHYDYDNIRDEKLIPVKLKVCL